MAHTNNLVPIAPTHDRAVVAQIDLIEFKMRWLDFLKVRNYIYTSLQAGASVEPGIHKACISGGAQNGYNEQALLGQLIVT